MKGRCFGFPGETGTLVGLDENDDRIVSLTIRLSKDPVDRRAILKVLAKRFIPVEGAGQFRSGSVKARNVWTPTLSLDRNSGELDVRVYTDGVRAAHEEWLAHESEVEKTDEKVRAIDSVFD